MKLSVRYEAIYQYENAVSFSPHVVRIFPRTDLFLKIDRMTFSTDLSVDIQFRRDLFDNLIACCFFPDPLSELPFSLELDIEVQERNPFHFLLDSRGMHIPCQYDETELAILAPFLASKPFLDFPSPLASHVSRPTVETLVTLNRWIYENLVYESREEGDPRSSEETLHYGAGSCRDFAVLLADVLRANSVAARFASGFIWEGDKCESDRRAASAMHAWVEAYLPGAGWIGMDPTNGVFCDHHFITTAVGLRYADISPVAGTYYGKKRISHELITKLKITRE